ncbi:uncharacterized protein LOC111056358 isoform X3 [Nilaparvata lugens]|uniref:uncharacterized protein LOC111056358 isoform X3 n=1 Tax=Nilaparvata lugens TaxID=108931 RepID=UPI00193DA56A|nr:uncharacterized protein LOC111056358 isoform X3 [Nilaparvata lugens]
MIFGMHFKAFIAGTTLLQLLNVTSQQQLFWREGMPHYVQHPYQHGLINCNPFCFPQVAQCCPCYSPPKPSYQDEDDDIQISPMLYNFIGSLMTKNDHREKIDKTKVTMKTNNIGTTNSYNMTGNSQAFVNTIDISPSST